MTTNGTARSREMRLVKSVPEDEPPRLVDWSARSRRTSLAWSAFFWAVRFLIFGLIGWLWFVWSAHSAWSAVSLAAVLAVAALGGITRYLSRVRADRRWRAMLDDYAEKEQENED
jgi:hypothetical protein